MLAFLHPGWMAVSLILAALTLRAGMRLRRLRLSSGPGRGAILKRHLALAKPAVLLIFVGFAGVGAAAFARILRVWRELFGNGEPRSSRSQGGAG